MTQVACPYALPANQREVFAEPLEHDFRAMHSQGDALVRAQFPFGGDGWIAVRYDIVKQVLADPRFTVDVDGLGDYARIKQVESGPPFPRTFIQYEGEMHARKRSVLARYLSVKRVRELRAEVTDLVDGLLDAVEAAPQPVDLASMFTRVVPVLVIGRLLGIPEGEQDRYLDAADSFTHARSLTLEGQVRALETVRHYFEELVNRRRARPGDDLLSALIVHSQDGSWTAEELTGTGVALLLAGHDTTASVLGGIVELLVHDAELFAELKNDPEVFTSRVDEFVRLLPAGLAGARTRVAAEDVQVGEILVRKGESVLPIVHAANFDGSVFETPESLDFNRTGQHVGFGHGPHACPGSQLARMEIDVAVQRLVERFDWIRPVESSDSLAAGRLLRGPKRIVVECA